MPLALRTHPDTRPVTKDGWKALIDEDVRDAVSDDIWNSCALLAQCLMTFEWRDTVWQIKLDRGTAMLTFVTYIADNDGEFDDARPLQARSAVEPFTPPIHQIRNVIHAWLCHEADEQMSFKGDKLFYPDHAITGEVEPGRIYQRR